MLIKKSQSEKHVNSPSCTVWEYEYGSQASSFAVSELNGRYPEEKMAVNTACEEVYYVLAGQGIVHTAKGDFKLEEGDLFYFEVGEPYWVEGTALKLVITNAPKWTLEQHKWQ